MKRFLYLVATDQIKGGIIPIVKAVLWVLSQVYAIIVILRRAFYRTGIFKCHKLSSPVISVGNLTVGGVGKTPLVEFIAQALKKKNIQPAILTRGYMGEGISAENQKSDEAQMLKELLSDVPILIGADRVKNANAFLKQNTADVFLLDDGFQHWRLFRDMDIVAIDTTNPWGNGCLLPRGILREPLGALLRAHVFVLTKTDLGNGHLQKIKNDLRTINPEAMVVESVHKPVAFNDIRSGEAIALGSVQGERICAISSIGDPGSFEKTLVKCDTDMAAHISFMDHHSYVGKDIEHIIKSCQDQNITTAVTTEKDAVKLKSFLKMFPSDICILSLKIKLSIINGEDAFIERICRIL